MVWMAPELCVGSSRLQNEVEGPLLFFKCDLCVSPSRHSIDWVKRQSAPRSELASSYNYYSPHPRPSASQRNSPTLSAQNIQFAIPNDVFCLSCGLFLSTQPFSVCGGGAKNSVVNPSSCNR